MNPAYETAMDLKKLLYEKEMANDGTDAQHSVYSFYVPTTNVVNIEEY